ncbi:MAG: PAS domain S-box protein [Syntrophomonas sp.]
MYETLSREELIDELKRAHGQIREMRSRAFLGVERLRFNEERFRLAISKSPTLVFTQDKDLRYTWILNPWQGALGEEILGKTDEELFPAEYSSGFTRIKRQVLETGLSAREEVRVVYKGEVIYYDLFIHPDFDSTGEVESITSIANNITEPKKAEEELRQSEDRFSTVFYSSPVMMTVTRIKDLKHIAVNDAWLNTLGYERSEIVGQYVFDGSYIDADDATELIYRISQEDIQNGFEVNVRTRSGQIRTCVSNWRQITIDDEPCILGAAVDITERKYVEEALRQSEERFYKAFHSSPVIMAIVSCDENRYIDINNSWLAAFGRARDEVLGRTPSELKLWIDNEDIFEKRSPLKTQSSLSNYEVSFCGVNGEISTGLASSEIIQVDAKDCYLHTMIDITKEKRLEKEISRLDRLNLVGEMAASIGHEIRNPMTSVRGFLQLLMEKKEYASDQEYFNLMIEELDRANEIITEYLRMAKDKKVDLQPGYLDSLVSSIYPIVQSDANRNGINIKLDLNKPPLLSMDENEIRQLILNMTRNSIEAMANGGTLSIGTKVHDNHIVLFVKDDGHGLPPHIQEKLGTPFLTTKDKGTGLGLAVCYSIAARHKASIDYLTGSAGTTFNVRFPI